MAQRAYWQGQIRLALVSIPVEVFPATRSGAEVSFRQIHQPSGKPIRYEKVADGVGPVDVEDIVKGYETSKGSYVLLQDQEIDAVRIESRKTLELVQFVPAHEIDPMWYEKPYFVVPADDLAEEAYVVLREALKAAGKVGIGQLSVRGREVLVALHPLGKGLALETLRYGDEVAKPTGYFTEIGDDKPDADLLNLAGTLIEKKTAPFDPGKFHDRYVEALHRLIEKKQKAKGQLVLEDADTEPSGGKGNVIDLMAALKKSVGETDKRSAPEKKPPTRRKRA